MAESRPEMTVKVFSVQALDEDHPLELILEDVCALGLEDRNRELAMGATPVRVEDISWQAQPGFWLFDFVRLRYAHGPGRASANRPVSGFDMRNGDGFAEETAMLYCPRTKMLFAQYNHFGLKDAGAAKYFGLFGPENVAIGYEFCPQLDDTVAAKLARADQFSTVRVKLARNEITSAYRENGVALERALDLGEGLQGPMVEVTISVGHTGQRLHAGRVRALIGQLQRLMGQHPGAVKTAEITGRDSSDRLSVNEVLDMLAPQKRYVFEVEKNLNDLRFTRASRYRALQQAYNAWRRTQRTP